MSFCTSTSEQQVVHGIWELWSILLLIQTRREGSRMVRKQVSLADVDIAVSSFLTIAIALAVHRGILAFQYLVSEYDWSISLMQSQ